MCLFLVHKKKKIILFIGIEGLDKPLFLCYNISMKDKKESFYFILSFAMKEIHGVSNPSKEHETCKKTVCGSTAHRKNQTASPLIE